MNLMQICGLCSILRIPFVVVVQQHLLKEKRSVRLRCILDSWNEEFVHLDSLAEEIKLRLSSTSSDNYASEGDQDADHITNSRVPTVHDSNVNTNTSIPRLECFFVDSDQYFGQDKDIDKTAKGKAAKKTLKTTEQKAESYVSALHSGGPAHQPGSTPVFAVDLRFRFLREYGTLVMEKGTHAAAAELGSKYHKDKRTFKTLSSAIDSVLRRVAPTGGEKKKGRQSHDELEPKTDTTVLLYSIPNYQFDLVTLRTDEHYKNNVDDSGEGFKTILDEKHTRRLRRDRG
jgi:hypothetical protein